MAVADSVKNIGTDDIQTGAVTNAKLANSAITLNGNSVALGDSATVGGASNALINGDMVIWQRGTNITAASTPVTNNDDTYVMDRWILLSDGNDIVDVKRDSTGVEGGSFWDCELEVETVDKKFGIVQIIEATNCHELIGGKASLSFYAKVAGSGKLDNVKAAIVSWAGTADSPTSDIVSAWGAEDTNPTLATSWTYENTPANLNVTTSWAEYKIENIDIDTASTNNVAVFIWSDVTDTDADDDLYITDVQLTPTTSAVAFDRKPISETQSDCERYYETSMEWGIVGQYAGQQVKVGVGGTTMGAATNNCGGNRYNTRKRVTPTVTLYDQNGTSGAVYTIHSGAIITGVVAQHLQNYGYLFAMKSTAFAHTYGYYYGWIAEAEL
tara:strand:- start:841 stop:1992 length:1152 start_codon:yes stop_codon:yes gene_type:complete